MRVGCMTSEFRTPNIFTDVFSFCGRGEAAGLIRGRVVFSRLIVHGDKSLDSAKVWTVRKEWINASLGDCWILDTRSGR